MEASELDPTVELGMLEDVRLADEFDGDCLWVDPMAGADLAGTWEFESEAPA